jgi:quinohemoprotein ethanol dehydrogenase
MSYNPQTGLVYIPSRGFDQFNYAADLDFKADPNRVGGASQTGNKNVPGATPKQPTSAIGPEPLEGGTYSTLVAFDPSKGEIRWRVPVGNSRYGGTLSTASNLLFQVAPNGSLIAYSADKGEKLYEIETGLTAGMGPPMTFMVDGKQYIALMGGNGGAPSPGVAGSSKPSAQKPMLLVFGLDGKAALPKQTSGPAPLPSDPH